MVMAGWTIALIIVLAILALSLISNLREIRLIFRGASRDDADEHRLEGGKGNKRLKK
jgi:hypothetical protein